MESIPGVNLIGNLSGAYGASYAADTEAEGIKAQAYQEKLKAGEEANLRRERLLKALSAQNVYSGASGVSGGSAEALQLQSIGEFRKEQQGASLMSSLYQSEADRSASATKSIGRQQATQSLLKFGTQFAGVG